MFALRKPSSDDIRQFLDIQRELDFSFAQPGATSDGPPDGFLVDHTRIELGEGGLVFAAARAAIQNWEQLRLDWIHVWPDDAPLEVGEAVATVARCAGLWWLNACKIVYLIDESRDATRYGFAYATLPKHAAIGEERFLVEMDDAGMVWYDILAFSRPNTLLSRVAYPVMRRAQRRFGRDSATAMRRSIESRLANGPNA